VPFLCKRSIPLIVCSRQGGWRIIIGLAEADDGLLLAVSGVLSS
jgi:hypothetical protein